MHELQCPIAPVNNRKPRIVKWCKPSRGTYKLNVDSNYLGNPGFASGWGVIRDYKG